MPNTKRLLTSLVLTAMIALGGCFPGVYKIDIQQGNVVTQDMIDELRPGMSKAQVRYIMGNPLITDTFHARRWDYLYSLQTGGGEKSQKRMSLYFNENDQLIAVSGDFRLKPGRTRDEAILGIQTTTAPTGRTPPEQAAIPPKTATPSANITPTEETEALPEASKTTRTDTPAATGSLETQIQQELDAVQPIQEQQPDPL